MRNRVTPALSHDRDPRGCLREEAQVLIEPDGGRGQLQSVHSIEGDLARASPGSSHLEHLRLFNPRLSLGQDGQPAGGKREERTTKERQFLGKALELR